ncbi:MAG: thioredoxin domain-containing protein [Deltaproteobacteria bacterium]|nr:thioredoxin domain-containing protein [Deltaproteobacteria bacterium]
MANLLAQEKSPYLLQHADNPVDWRPWGEAALALARQENKPIFLSIGYATCHWCHVMAHESFEDQEVAAVLNQYYVAIKVDREERPDLDSIYMTVATALSGSGGWPLSVWLTPEGQPFLAGTYFPKTARLGRPGFLDILREVARRWNSPEEEKIRQAGRELTRSLQMAEASPAGGGLGREDLARGYQQMAQSFDATYGGFGQAPKFPSPHHLTFLLRWQVREPESGALALAEKTLTAMHQGGMFDQVGLGFHRYSVDQRWLVPHFEKMLYDQAMLAMAYLEAFQLTENPAHARAAREIFTYVLRDLTAPEGGFYSAEDADSEGHEGLYYVWNPEQVDAVLGRDLGGLFCRFYGVTPGGNFEQGLSIPHVTRSVAAFAKEEGLTAEQAEARLAEARERLCEARAKRVHPLKDDKVLTSWNGLMIAALALGYRALGEEAYLQAAEKAARFGWEHLQAEGRLERRWREGHLLGPGFADDYANFTWGLVELYEAGFDPTWLNRALTLQESLDALFWDEAGGGYFLTPAGGEELILRNKEIYDGAVPSANSVAALNLVRLGRLSGRAELEERAQKLFQAFAAEVTRYPMAYTHLLGAVDFALGPGREVVLAGEASHPETQAMLAKLRQGFRPREVVLWKTAARAEALAQAAPFTREMPPGPEGPLAYVCRDFACQAPVSRAADLAVS